MENIKKKYQIVVARYNEDIRWLTLFKNITVIYNKGLYDTMLDKFSIINLENVGRESHTYLYHIFHNYDNLAERTIFFQGKISDHKILALEEYFGKDDFIGKFSTLSINKLKKNVEHFGKWEKEYKNNDMLKCNLTPYEWLKNIAGLTFNENILETNVVWGANFSLSKEIIHKKPKSFYENILRFIDTHKNPELGHYLERSWYLIFNNTFIEKEKLGYFFVKNNLDIFLENINKNVLLKFNEIHIWYPIHANYELGEKYKISYTPNNNKYLLINPYINQNEFYLDIKGANNAYILIEFDDDTAYEVQLDIQNKGVSQINNYYKNQTINTYTNKILENNNYNKITFSFNEKVIIKHNEKILFDFNNIFEIMNIKSIKIKSYNNSSIFWDYNHVNANYENIKFYQCLNKYEDIRLFYTKYYLDNYIEELRVLNV